MAGRYAETSDGYGHMSRRTFKNNSSGFTLVELLVVVAIIAILAAIAIPYFSRHKTKAYVATLNADVKNAYTAAQAYLTDNPDVTIDSMDKLDSGGFARSQGITLESGDMTLTSGSITLKGAFPISNNNTSVTYNGNITWASE